MKVFLVIGAVAIIHLLSFPLSAQTSKGKTASAKESKSSASNKFYIDVHHLGAGKVTAKDLAGAHQKDLAVQQKYGVNIIKYWFDEAKGDVYCLASSPDSQSLRKTHAEAHGLVPDQIYEVTGGKEELANGGKNFFLDVHELGAGKVTAKDVAGAHQKDLAVEKKYDVNLINYWVDEKKGVVMCLAQAPDSAALINTHKEAHGLIPVKVMKVKQGQ
jgi:hypothetical protein